MLSVVVAAPGCRPELDFEMESFEAPTAEISGTPEEPSLLFTSDAGRATVVFTANRRWSAEFVNDRAAEWCSLSATEGRGSNTTLYVSVTQNQNYDERSASILFTCDDVTRTLVVTQKQKDAVLLDGSVVQMSSDGGSFTVRFRANVECRVAVDGAASDWIIPLNSKGLTEYSASFTVKQNETLEPRQGRIDVMSSLGKESVKVYQEGETPTLVLGAHDVEVAATGEIISLQVTSNLDVTFDIKDGTWIREVSTKTISTNTYYFTVDRNQKRQNRSTSIVFQDKARGISDEVRINQLFQPILSGSDPLTVPSRSVNFQLQTVDGVPDDFTVSSSASWIVPGDVKQDGKGCRLSFKTNPNRSGMTRSGVVKVYFNGYDTPDEVKVSQVPLQPCFSFTTRLPEVKAPHFAQSGDGFILWGDGSFDWFDKLAGKDKDVVHVYNDGARVHIVVVESGAIPWLLVDEPQDDMHFDFTTLK